jgi:glutamyl-tRNA(Gln) amidotransferase subunit E
MHNFDDLDFYQSLGFRCGLEVHRQIATEKKLFCQCPVKDYSDHFDAEILRHMRPTLSELGEYDPCALMEFKTKKQIIYRLNRETVCTYEMDDAPPFALNREALEKALVIALMLNLNLVDELHVARKQYLDGSIPTGFQRTLILGVNGYIIVGGRRIGIRQLGLEEDACRQVSDIGHKRTFMTDRLSIPLIEIVTEADARTPNEARAIANEIRKLCHLSGLVRTGAGRVRQDVNVSIKGGARAEIKGVPSIRQIPKLAHYEAIRQKALLELKEAAHKRGLDEKAFDGEPFLVTEQVMKMQHPVLSKECARGGVGYALRFPKCAGLFVFPVGPNRHFSDEVADRVRVIACLDRMPNMAHTDEVTMRGGVIEEIRRMIGAGDEDLVVVLAGPKDDVQTAIEEVKTRMKEMLAGVPRETRRALPTGETEFERILPGPQRMYPDTDLPPVVLKEEDFAKARKRKPEDLQSLVKRLKALGLSDQQIDNLILKDRLQLFQEALEVVKLRARILAYLVGDYMDFLERKFPKNRVTKDLLKKIFGREEAASMTQKEASALLENAVAGHGVENG